MWNFETLMVYGHSLVPEKLYSLGVGTDKIASGLYAASGITGVSISQGIQLHAFYTIGHQLPVVLCHSSPTLAN